MSVEGKILVVDDMKVNVKILSVKLAASGYEVLKAYDGETAVEVARREKPDVILLDIMMPGMDGYEVTEILKNDPETDYIPIVLVTALKGVDDKVKGFDAGADDFITKPPNQTELLARVRSLVKLKKLQEESRVWAAKKKFGSTQVVPATSLGAAVMGDKPGDRGSVLIVEEDEKTAAFWTRALSEKNNCVTASSGKKAFNMLEAAVPELIILELLLPDMDGLDFLKRVKKNADYKDISVIVLSSVSDVETRVRAIDLGADDFLEKPVNAIELLARVGGAMRKHRARSIMKNTLDEVFKLSISDSLTGLFNRQYFNSYIDKTVEISKRHNRDFSVMFIDIDHFKNINDTYGHSVGDEVIKGMAGIFTESIRSSDVIARYGGEEFVAVLSDTEVNNAMIAAEKLRGRIEDHKFSGINDTTVTASIGIAGYLGIKDTADDIVRRADEALYKAKQGGRNRVERSETAKIA